MKDRPQVTFPDKVAEVVASRYLEASVILEYGSGGSTVLAAETPGVVCFSVESDKAWAEGMQTWLDRNVPDHHVTLHHAYIGKTGKWGRPKKVRRAMIPWYLQYPRSVWRRSDFRHPDVVLIDGRFRVGCFLTTISKITRPTTILLDDYADRKKLHIVEKYATPNRLVGDRMAVFEVEPRPLSLPEWIGDLKASCSPG